MTTKKNKRIIFSNIEPYSNCGEDCPKDGNCDCDVFAMHCEEVNLNIELPGRILAIADLGMWNGRFSGYKILPANAKNILYSECDYIEIYGEGKAIKATMHHHDGTNYLEYRVIREDKNIENLTKKLYNQDPVSRQMINNYTRSLYPYIAKVYGW